MLEKELNKIERLVFDKLKNLSVHLTYHNIHHTIDVVQQSARIAKAENITDEKELFLLHVAALYHDTGFLKKYKHHEDESCALFLENTSAINFSAEEESIVLGLIDATRLPQTPKTHLEAIICDADLDYLGRTDFAAISQNLKKEFIHFNIVNSEDEWNALQLNFVTQHKYFTSTSRELREPVKQVNLQNLKV